MKNLLQSLSLREVRSKMDQHTTVGIFGWVASFGLAEYHLVSASVAATLTAVYMAIAIYKKLSEK